MEATMDKIIKRCVSCLYRHGYCSHFDEYLQLNDDENCKHWKLGKCYTCKHKDAPDEEWFKRGCESECFSGCETYKRDWKKTWKWFKQKWS